MIMMTVLAAGSVLIAGTPAFAHNDATTTTTSVKPGTSDDYNNWYHDYYCAIVAQHGQAWHLYYGSDCNLATTTATTAAPATTAGGATTTEAPATTTTAAPQVPDEMIVVMLTATSAPVAADSDSWITANWTALGGNADVFHVTATADNGVSVSYPENTGSYSSLYRDDQLADLELDYTALKLAVPAGVTGNVTLTLHLTYHTDQGNKDETFTVSVPVAA
jgi:hypothetical protein